MRMYVVERSDGALYAGEDQYYEPVFVVPGMKREAKLFFKLSAATVALVNSLEPGIELKIKEVGYVS